MSSRIHRGRVTMAAAMVTVAAVLIAAAGCSRQPPPAPVPPPPDPTATARAAWNDFADRFIEGYFKSHPFFAVQSGRHEFDGQMPDWSAASLQKEIDRLKLLRTQAEGISAEPLEPAQRLSHDRGREACQRVGEAIVERQPVGGGRQASLGRNQVSLESQGVSRSRSNCSTTLRTPFVRMAVRHR